MSLRFDSAEAFAKGGESGPVVNQAQLDQSLLLSVIGHGGDIKMPPEKKLPDDAIATLREWVLQGAPWPATSAASDGESLESKAKEHWAFQPVTRPAIPEVKSEYVCQTPIDQFILARLESKDLVFAPQADRRTLIRRLSFDLVGLPPTNDEIEEFLEDESPDAFERVTDRLLASPHYGERWARHWLDVARYADTKGYVFVADRRYPFAFTYRDYVIRAFNEDLPYNQFIMEQIAADQLPANSDPRSLAAMGFLTVGRRFLNNGHDIIDDRIDVVSRGLLGLTVTCARCHDHKYDPIPSEDYYSLYGVFASSHEPGELPVVGEGESRESRSAFDAEMVKRQGDIETFVTRKTEEKQDRLRKEFSRLIMGWHEVAGNAADPRIEELARQVGVSQGLVKIFMRRWQEFLQARLSPSHPVFGLWARLTGVPEPEFAAKSNEVMLAITSEPEMARTVVPVVAEVFRGEGPKSMRDVVEKYGTLLSSDKPEAEAAKRILDEADSPFKLTRADVVETFDQGERNELQGMRNRIEELKIHHPGAPDQAMVMRDNPTPQDSPVFVRGNPSRPGEAVPRRFLSLLERDNRRPFANGSGRLELAQRIASESNPLTSRVIVNRLWHWHFGVGLARSTSDFGMRSDKPSHPDLLDYMAATFVEERWSLKFIHRLIAGSRVYQQSSEPSAESRSTDAENELVSSFRRRRLELEELRDALLDASGTLDLRMHGRSQSLTGDNPTRRRAVYGAIDRQNLEGFFRTFDFANPNTSAPLRFTTSVPQQSLFLMNSPFVINTARTTYRDVCHSSMDSIEARINSLYLRILRREADAEEILAGRQFIERELSRSPTSASSAWQWGVGELSSDNTRIDVFTPFKHFSTRGWHVGKDFPDSQLGFAILSATGGHPGPNAHAVIRRWTAPQTLKAVIKGTLRHPSEKGDGVRSNLISNRKGRLGEWNVKQGEASTSTELFGVEAGETLDFVVSAGDTADHDSFTWTVAIEAHAEGGSVEQWNSKADFSGPTEPMNPWEKYAQALLLTNEFSFVD